MIDTPGIRAVELFFEFLTYYGYVGAAVAALFLIVGVDRIDPDARGSYLFRLLLLPATVAFWPLILWRWQALARRGEEQ